MYSKDRTEGEWSACVPWQRDLAHGRTSCHASKQGTELTWKGMEMGRLQGTGVCSMSVKLRRIHSYSEPSVIQNNAGRTEDNREGRGSVTTQDRCMTAEPSTRNRFVEVSLNICSESLKGRQG